MKACLSRESAAGGYRLIIKVAEHEQVLCTLNSYHIYQGSEIHIWEYREAIRYIFRAVSECLADRGERNILRVMREYVGKHAREDVIRAAIKGGLDVDDALSQISDYLGFSSQSHFSKLFKKHVGKIPREYQNSHL